MSQRRPRLPSVLFALCLLSALPALAQDEPSSSQGSPSASQSDPEAALTPSSEAAKATPAGAASCPSEAPCVLAAWPEHGYKRVPNREVDLKSELVVQVSDLTGWLGAAGKDCWAVRLFFDGQPVERLEPQSCDLGTNTLRFEMSQIQRSQEPVWSRLLVRRTGFTSAVDVSVGLLPDEGDASRARPLFTKVTGNQQLSLLLVPLGRFVSLAILFAGLLTAFFILARRSDIIRDNGPAPPSGKRRPYSLARSQMACWFFLILWAFLLISLLSGEPAAIPVNLLGLMGISAGTFLGAELIDQGKRQGQGEQAQPEDGAGPETEGFIWDILRTADGVAFHRFQIAAWTLVLGFFFLWKVWSELVMPSFDTTLLGLMGISSGTYLGVKMPEGNKAG